MAVLSASEELVEQVQSYRAFSAGWTSRILQASVAWLHEDPGTQALVSKAGKIYQERRNKLASELRTRGIDVIDGGGLCLFMPVHSETFALITLAAHGISAVPGESFSLAASGHVRFGTGRLGSEDCKTLADIASLAAAEPFNMSAEP